MKINLYFYCPQKNSKGEEEINFRGCSIFNKGILKQGRNQDFKLEVVEVQAKK